ncbi:MAG: hypothetical protein KGK03_03810 [Candidatus Omnitrophica bacterium]|nr:hypothetical protein [Candidatus Omnitrophota bacterium]
MADNVISYLISYIYNVFKRAAFVFSFVLFGIVPCLAQDYAQGMRSLVVNELMQYGQQLYDRGDMDGAKAVFGHVLSYDKHQPQALKYLKQMGYVPPQPVTIPKPVPVVLPAVVVPSPALVKIDASDKQAVDAVNVADIESLKKAIDAQKRIIEKLKVQVQQMRSSLESET